MIVQCPSCAAKFRVADDKIKPTGVKVRCGRCKTVFRVRRADDSGLAAPLAGVGAQRMARAPAPPPALDEEATRVVHDPVGEALDDMPSGLDNPLLRTGQSPRGLRDFDAYVSSPGDPVAAAAASSPGLTPPPERRGNTLLGFEPTSLSDKRLQTAQTRPTPKPGDNRPEWLIGSAEGSPPVPVGDPDGKQPARQAFQPAITDEHAPRRTTLTGVTRFEPALDLDAGPRPARRDALDSLADPMPPDTLDWDVEGETAPRHTFDRDAVADDDDDDELEGPTAPTRPSIPSAAQSQPVPASPPPLRPRPAPAQSTPAPTGPPPAEPEEAPDSSLEGFTFSHRVIARDERVAVWLGTTLGIVLALVGFALFLAARNDWLLDFAELDQMLGVAFGGETYEARHLRTVRIYELEGERVEEALDAPGPGPAEGLEVGNLEQSVYRTQADVPLLLIEGDLLNHDHSPHRAVFVLGRLLQGDQPVSALVAPVGRTLSQEELETILAPEALDALYARVAEEAAALVIQPNQRSRFSLVFPDFEGTRDDAQLSYTVEVARTEHPDAAGDWLRIEYYREEDEATEP